jgi:hypothetical protein
MTTLPCCSVDGNDELMYLERWMFIVGRGSQLIRATCGTWKARNDENAIKK